MRGAKWSGSSTAPTRRAARTTSPPSCWRIRMDKITPVKFAIFFVPLLAFGQAQTYATFTFDPPGSTNTFVNGINNAGQIVGSYLDASGASHNFIRSADGVTYTTIDLPGALP